MKTADPAFKQNFVAEFGGSGILTLSFRGSAPELAVHLMAPEKDGIFLEGSSTTLPLPEKSAGLSAAFYRSMHALVTDDKNAEAPLLLSAPRDIVGKEITIWTRPPRLENMTGEAHPEAISIWCQNDALYMAVTGQDVSFPSHVEHMVYDFPLGKDMQPPRQADTNKEKVVSRFVDLLATYGTPVSRP